MKKIYKILFALLICSVFLPRVYGKGRYIGTCYCWNYIAGSTLRINCEDNPYTGVNTPQEIIDFGYDGVCDYICSNNSNSYWYNKKGVEDVLYQQNHLLL